MPRPACFIAILLLAGCVHTGTRTPDYLSPRKAPTNAVAPAPSTEPERREVEIAAALRKAELGVEDLLYIAERNNPEVRAAWNSVEAAAGRAWQAKLYPNPSLELEAEGIPAENASLSRSENKIAIVQPFALADRRSAAASAAQSEHDAHYFRALHRVRTTQGDVLSAYAELVYGKEAIALTTELHDMALRTLSIAKNRFEAQAAPESEVIKADIDVRALELDRRRLTRQLAVSHERLTALLGNVRIPEEKIGERPFEDVPELDIDALRASVRERHPAVLAANKDIEAARRRMDEAKAERIPDIDVRLAYGRDADANENFLEAGISIPLPLFNRNQGRILESRRLAAMAERNAESIANALQSELAAAHASLVSARDEAETLRNEIVPSAEKAFQQAEAGYRAGKVGFLDLLDAQRTLAERRLSLLDSLRNMNVAMAELWQIAGRETGH